MVSLLQPFVRVMCRLPYKINPFRIGKDLFAIEFFEVGEAYLDY